MHEPTSTNPTPTAVPWTPDMKTAPAPVMSPAPGPVPAQAAPAQHVPPAQPAYPAAPQYQAAQPVAPQPATPQPVAPQPAAPQPAQAYIPQAPQTQPVPATPMTQQTHYAPPAAAPQNVHAQTMQTQTMQAQAAQVQTPQMQTPPAQYAQQAQAHPAHGQYAPAAAQQHFPQAPISPLVAPQMQRPVQAEPPQSNSLIANLLKRSPKPDMAAAMEGQPVQAATSLFNKNFALGAVTGLVIGAFVLPMILNLIGGGDAAVQKQALAATPTAVTIVTPPAPAGGEVFIDQAISTDAPNNG